VYAKEYAMLWDYLKMLIMLRLTLQAPCMCASCKRGRRRLENNREKFRLHAGDLLIERAICSHGWDNLPPLQGAA
jgi:hypothetical protein